MIELEAKCDDIKSEKRSIQYGQVDDMSWRGRKRVAELEGCGRLNGREKSCASFLPGWAKIPGFRFRFH